MKKFIVFLFLLITTYASAQVSGIWSRVTASGTNTYTAPAPSGCTCASYVDGARFQTLFTNANTSTSVTLNINSIGAKTVYNSAGQALSVGEIKASDEKIITYSTSLNGFRVLGGSSESTTTWGSITGTLSDQTDLNTALSGKQPIDSDLTSIGGLTPSNDDIIQRKSGAWTNRTPAQLKTDLSLTKSDVGLGNVDNTSDANKPVSTAQQTAIDAKVADAINDGTTTIAPSQNAVFDALALKAPLASPTFTGTPAAPTASGNTNSTQLATTAFVKTSSPTEYGIACSDLTTALTTGTTKAYFRVPKAFTVTGVRASVLTAQTSGSILTIDINENGTTILSTKLTIDNSEKTSTTAATAPVISDSSLADDAEITIDIDQVGSSPVGLIVWLIGY